MLEIPSLSGAEERLAEFLTRRMREMGLRTAIDDAGNAIGVTSGDPLRSSPGVADIVLLGHMDVVPGEIPVRLEGDLLYGRGAVDAKGPLAAFALAAAAFAASLPKSVRLVVIGAVEEEAATSKGARAVISRYQPAACVIGEPSGWDAVTIGYKGRLLARFHAQRTVAHTAGPGASAADECFRWWSSVLAGVALLNQGRNGPFQSVQASLRRADTTSDGLTERVEALAGFRLPPGISPAQMREVCENAARNTGSRNTESSPAAEHAADTASTVDTGAECIGDETAIVADRASPLVRAFTGALRARGLRPQLVLKTGTSDMNVVAAPGCWACPILAYGPGDSALDHTPSEHISISEFLRSIDVMRDAIASFASELAEADQSHAVSPSPS
jgi:LysW-gamma-L-lysine carboxypeptidase